MDQVPWSRTLLLLVVSVIAFGGILALIVARSLGESTETAPHVIVPSSAPPATTATPADHREPAGDPCGPVESTASTPYAITGFWLQPSESECDWYADLGAIRRIGGDTVIRLGRGIDPRRAGKNGRIYDGDKRDTRFDRCQEGGKTCYQAAEKALKDANSKNSISGVYVYEVPESFGPGVVRCAGFDRRVDFGSQVYFRMLVPESGPDAGCDFSEGKKYRLYLIKGSREDNVDTLLKAAERFNIDVFTSLPVAARDPKASYRADRRHASALAGLTRRIVRDYRERYGELDSMQGFYQPFEVQLRDWNKDTTMDVYAAQHKAVHEEFPNKPVLVSPFWDARRKRLGTTPEQAGKAFMRLAKSGADIIAPQDSRGTGKVPLYTGDQAGSKVEKALRPVEAVRSASYKKNYFGSTRDFYRAAAQARERLAEEGRNVALWGNIEAFEPTGNNCGDKRFTGGRGRTDKKRLDRAIGLAGTYVSKLISYAWTDFYQCGSPSLSAEIARDFARPIVVNAFPQERGEEDGLAIYGYGLTQSTVITLSWKDSSATIDLAQQGIYDEQPADHPPRMRMAWVPFEMPGGKPWIKVKAKAGNLETTHAHVFR